MDLWNSSAQRGRGSSWSEAADCYMLGLSQNRCNQGQFIDVYCNDPVISKSSSSIFRELTHEPSNNIYIY